MYRTEQEQQEDQVRRCAWGCGMPAEPGDIYCAGCATARGWDYDDHGLNPSRLR